MKAQAYIYQQTDTGYCYRILVRKADGSRLSSFDSFPKVVTREVAHKRALAQKTAMVRRIKRWYGKRCPKQADA